MKRGICIVLSALLLAVPVQAQAQEWITGYGIKETPHTFTVKAGAGGLAKDGQAVTLPEGAEAYQKDGVLMLSVEPFLNALWENISVEWDKFQEGVLYAIWGNHYFTFDVNEKAAWDNGRFSISLPGMERRGNQLFLPLRDWQEILPEFYCNAQDISWDAKTRTATLRYTTKELETGGEVPAPTGTGVMPEYTLQPTMEYTRIKNLGGGYFSAETPDPERKTLVLDSSGKTLQAYGGTTGILYAGEDCFQIEEQGPKGEDTYITDKSGKKLFQMGLKDDIRFVEGLSKIKKDRAIGFLDTKGALAIPAEYFSASDFSEGLAAVGILDKTLVDDWHAGRRWGYIDKKGTLVIDTKYTSCGSFHEGLAYACSDDKFNGKFGYIDKTGREVIPPQYDWASDFYNGTAFVLEGGGWEDGRLWVIDHTGEKIKLLAKTRFADSSRKMRGTVAILNDAVFRGMPMQFYTYFDAGGELTYAESVWLQNSSDGLMAVQDEKTEKWGYVDKDWHWVIAPIFDDVESFRDGYAVVQLKTEQGDTEKGIIKKP